MFRRNHKSFLSLLALALLVGQAAGPLRAQEPAKRVQFAGSMFDGGRKKGEGTKESSERKGDGVESGDTSAAPSPSPVPYMTVAVKYAPGAGVEPQSSTTQQPAPSSNNPPAQTGAPAQGPQTASPTQSQTQQSANPAAPAQGQQPAQPAVPPTAPADANLPAPQAPAPSAPARPQPGAPGGQVQAPVGPSAPGRESVPTAPDARLDVPQVAPDFRAEEGPFPALERVGVDMGEQRALSVREVIEMALANNKDIEVARENVRAAEFDLQAARGVYDPRFQTNSYYERTEQPAASFLSGSSTGAVTQSGLFSASSVQGLTPKFGGGYRLDFVNNRVTTNNQFAALNPQYPTALTFSYTQPVLRGLRFDQNRRAIEIAKKNLSLTDAQFRQRAIETITQVEQAYWDLVFALRNLQVQIDAVKQARTQVESNQRLVQQGVIAPIDIVAASTQVTTFEQNVYTAQEAVTRAENTLKTLILPDRNAPLWSKPLTPVTPVSLEAPRVPLEQATAAALKSRPELAQLQTSAEINQIDARYFRDLTRPQLDLVGTYTSAGLAGALVTPTGNTNTGANALLRTRVNELSAIAGLEPLPTTTATSTVNENLVGGLPKSLSNLAQQDYPTYRVGVRVELPLRNRTAQANYGRSLAEGRRIQNQRAQAEQVIEADVRNAVQSLRSAESRLASAAASRRSAELQYESEQRQFRAGTTTIFLVLQRQNELLAARGRELQAQTDLNKAIAEFQRATGNTLEANNVAVRTDGPARELELRPAQGADARQTAPPKPTAQAPSTPSGLMGFRQR